MPTFEGQVICSPCIRQAWTLKHENVCKKCGRRFLTGSPKTKSCPECYQPVGGDCSHVYPVRVRTGKVLPGEGMLEELPFDTRD